jgi:hypothetical protein
MNNEPELLIDSASGIYIPQEFAKTYNVPENFQNYEEIKKDIEFLSKKNSQKSSEYYEIWDNILNKAKMTNGKINGYLYHCCDLWFVPENYDNEDFFN